MTQTLHSGDRVRRTALLGAVAASLVLVGVMVDAKLGGPRGGALIDGFENPSNVAEMMLLNGDGQFYAGVARDPTLSRPEVFERNWPGGAPAQYAYRAQRGSLGYLSWALSAGRPGLVPWVMMVLVILGGAFAAGAGALILADAGVREWPAALLPLLPGAIGASLWLGPEMLGLAFVLVGWRMRRVRPWLAVGALAIAGLLRETYLLVPLTIALLDRDVRFLAPAAAWAAWLLAVCARLSVTPLDVFRADPVRTVAWPFLGLADAAGAIGVAEVAIAIFGIALVVAAWRHPVVRAYALLWPCLGPWTWEWRNFPRIVLPLYAFGVLHVATSRSRAREAQAPV